MAIAGVGLLGGDHGHLRLVFCPDQTPRSVTCLNLTQCLAHGLLEMPPNHVRHHVSFSPILHGQTDAGIFQMPDASMDLKQRSIFFFSPIACHGRLQMMPRDFRRLIEQ